MKPKVPTSKAKPVRKSPEYPGVVRGPASSAKSQRGTELPHERDETTGPQRGTRAHPEIRQAHRDLASGKVDTDLRGTAVGTFKRATRNAKGNAKPAGR